MNFGNMFEMMNSVPDENNYQEPSFSDYLPQGPHPYQPNIYDQAPTMNWEEAFAGFKTHPTLYNLDGYISPYASNNWGGTSGILQYLDEQSNIPHLDNRIDPNKIFTSEINGLRAIAGEQQRIIKMMEARLKESLTEKGKIGLTEEDIEAFNALTTARNTIANIYKEQVTVKKNIAELKIKQNQQQTGTSTTTGTNASTTGGRGPNAIDVGKAILDNIFDAPAIPTVQQQATIPPYAPSDIASAEQVINGLVPTIGSNIRDESVGAEKFVVVGDTDDDYEFIAEDKYGNEIPLNVDDSLRIDTIDRETSIAKDNLMQEWKVKYK